MGSINVHKLKHYRSRALLKRLKLKPDHFARRDAAMKHEKHSGDGCGEFREEKHFN